MEQMELPELETLRLMQTARESDRREAILMRQGKAWIQVPGMGHEPIVTLAHHLKPDDLLFPYYRDRPLVLARGMTTREIAQEFLAKASSSSGGRHMGHHHSNRRLNIFSVATPTGAQCLPAAGAAWGCQLKGSDSIVVCSIGEASTRQGEFYEALGFAVQENLPIIFMVEDNAYGISTPTEKMLLLRRGVFSDDLVMHVDARDTYVMFEKGGEAVRRVRQGGGPLILWCELDRLGAHTSADGDSKYRSAEDRESMWERDPIHRFVQQLYKKGVLTVPDWQKMQDEIRAEIDALYIEVEKEPLPEPARVMEHLYGPTVVHSPMPFPEKDEETTMVAAINRTLAAGLAKDSSILLFGEDIEDPKGGVFGFTEGLSTKFPGRVVNSPLAEATIVGLPPGLSATGFRPVFEVQFIDFILPGFNQLATQLATLRWRTMGDWTCPALIYAPYGAYLPGGGPWHSESRDGWWAHMIGMRVAIPSTPADVAGLFWAAFEDEDPTLILIPKHLFRVRMPVAEYKALPFGKAAVRRAGDDVTVVSWGNCMELAEKAAVKMEEQGVSVEVIDLRTLVPCDWETVDKSLAKTGRLVVIHESNRTCGFGEAVVTEMVTDPERFYYLLSPPQLVARKDVFIPYHPNLEYEVLPDLDDVLRAIQITLEK